MSGIRRFQVGAVVIVGVALAVGLWGWAQEPPAEKNLDVRVFGHSEFFLGARATIRVITVDFKTDAPIAEVEVSLFLKNTESKQLRPLAEGKTDAQGTLEADFKVPDLKEAKGKYEILVRSKHGEEKGEIRYPVKLKSAFSTYLTTDKPIYQPAQEMHIRALILRKFDLKPLAGEKILIEIEDPKGNKVFKKEETLSKFGIAATKFILADEVSLGRYTVRLKSDSAKAEKKVTVDRYVLPKFKVKCKLEKDFYFPKEMVKGKLAVDYFFGKPVVDAKVEVKASTFEVSFRKFATWQGKTGEGGECEFEIKLPDYFVGQPLMQGKGLVKFDIQVTDTADHKEKKTVNTTVSEGSLVIHAFPEGGRVVRGLENGVFIATTYPDGSPAKCEADCTIRFRPLPEGEEAKEFTCRVSTDALGIGERSGKYGEEDGQSVRGTG
ncbi:MAG: MG2 domain-containing protein [Planctomycetota bacterium]|jgi:uncharacterized protein YfaS (alpha-2-macroglobulin family)